MSELGRVVLSSREQPILIEPFGNGLRGVTLRFAHEVRREADYFGEIPEVILPPEMLKLAKHIIETKVSDFDPTMLEDHYRNALVDILRRKQAAKHAIAATGPVKPSPENVVSLMETLRRSIAAEGPVAKIARRFSARWSERSTGYRHSGPEPEVDLDGTSIAAQTLFDRMTKFGLDQMPAIEIQLTCEILGDTRDAERDAVTSTPSYGNAARYLVRRIKERKAELRAGDGAEGRVAGS